MAETKRGLGRGLDVLLGTTDLLSDQVSEKELKEQLQTISVEKIKPGKYQPRTDINPEALEELAASIKQHGVIQPVVVRETGPDSFELIAGERRWRASQLAGVFEVPAVVKNVDDETAGALALIENIQREDLNAIEEAIALHRLIDDFGLTHQQVADAVGKSRTTVTNVLRLMALEREVKIYLERGDLEMGHARALLSLDGKKQIEAAKLVVARNLSVRETEKLVRQYNQKTSKSHAQNKLDPNVAKLQQSLSEKLCADVDIKHKKSGKGILQIRYNSLDELDGILSHID